MEIVARWYNDLPLSDAATATRTDHPSGSNAAVIDHSITLPICLGSSLKSATAFTRLTSGLNWVPVEVVASAIG